MPFHFSMLVLFLVRHTLSVTFVLRDFCPCDKTSGTDANCSCEPATSGLPESYPLYGNDFLPKCPASAFQTQSELNQWLPDEIFCLKADRRGTNPKYTYTNTFDVTYVPESMPTPTAAPSGAATLLAETGYAYGDEIQTTNGPLTFPAAAGLDSACQLGTPVRFLQDITNEQCFFANATEFTYGALNLTGLSILTGPNSSTTITTTVIEIQDPPIADPSASPEPTESESLSEEPSATEDPGTGAAELLNWDADLFATDSVVRSITATFLYDETTLTITSADITVNTYAAGDQSGTITVNVMFRTTTSSAMPKSGDVGYAIGRPVIAGRLDETLGLFVTADDGAFPVPTGATCASGVIKYTPLLFGIETIAGCTATNTPDETLVDLTNYTHVAKYGTANASLKEDWVEIQGTTECTAPRLQKYYFFFEKFGDVTNPQNRIVSVFRTCTTVTPYDQRIFVATFLQRVQTTFRYKPPNPRVPGIPPDTFYPFSAASAAPAFPSPSRMAMAFGSVLCVCALFIA